MRKIFAFSLTEGFFCCTPVQELRLEVMVFLIPVLRVSLAVLS